MAIILDPSTGFDDTGTGAVGYPAGTTAQRPSNPSNGFKRYNTDYNGLEVYINGAWVVSGIGTYSADVLLVAGGGGGGGTTNWHAGGGGAGGVLQLTGNRIIAGTAYSVIVGAGGTGGPPSSPSEGVTGSNSSFNGATVFGGGFGTGEGSGAYIAGNGGSGGGAGSYVRATMDVTFLGGVGALGQGNSGGTGRYTGSTYMCAGGGGGAASPGGNGPNNSAVSGSGGNGIISDITGTATYYGGGGGGGGGNGSGSIVFTTNGLGGLGGGGAGGLSGVGNAASANSGGGGGGAGRNSGGTALAGGNGGSGIVIIRYLGPQRAIGGIVSSNSGYTIHTFTSSGTFTA